MVASPFLIANDTIVPPAKYQIIFGDSFVVQYDEGLN